MSRLFEPSEPLAKTEDIALRTIPYNYLAVERHHNRNHLLSRLVADLITLSARRASHLLACFLSSFSLPGRSGLFPPGTNELPKIWSPSLVTTFCSKVWPRSSADPELWLPNHCLEFSPAELPMNLPPCPCDLPEDSRVEALWICGCCAGGVLACEVRCARGGASCFSASSVAWEARRPRDGASSLSMSPKACEFGSQYVKFIAAACESLPVDCVFYSTFHRCAALVYGAVPCGYHRTGGIPWSSCRSKGSGNDREGRRSCFRLPCCE
jgi:hypothetical protein